MMEEEFIQDTTLLALEDSKMWQGRVYRGQEQQRLKPKEDKESDEKLDTEAFVQSARDRESWQVRVFSSGPSSTTSAGLRWMSARWKNLSMSHELSRASR